MRTRQQADLESLRAALADAVPAGQPRRSLGSGSRVSTPWRTSSSFSPPPCSLLMIIAMATAIGFATRGAMAGNREIIEVLHFVGAEDRYIARQFQTHFMRLGLQRRGDRRIGRSSPLRGRLVVFGFILPLGRGTGDRRPVWRIFSDGRGVCGDLCHLRGDRRAHRLSLPTDRIQSSTTADVSRIWFLL